MAEWLTFEQAAERLDVLSEPIRTGNHEAQLHAVRTGVGGPAVRRNGIGPLTGDAAKLILALLAQLAEMERAKIKERTAAGRAAARAALATTGRTHRGKASLDRPEAHHPVKVAVQGTVKRLLDAKVMVDVHKPYRPCENPA